MDSNLAKFWQKYRNQDPDPDAGITVA